MQGESLVDPFFLFYYYSSYKKGEVIKCKQDKELGTCLLSGLLLGNLKGYERL